MVPLGIDKEKLAIQLGRLHDHIKELEKIKENLDAKKQRDILMSAAERVLHLAIEDCLNIASHIVSGRGFRRADTYKELFLILKDEGVISDNLGKEMMKLASFRNRLVHLYWEVNEAEVVEKINNLDVFRKYAEEIIRLIK